MLIDVSLSQACMSVAGCPVLRRTDRLRASPCTDTSIRAANELGCAKYGSRMLLPPWPSRCDLPAALRASRRSSSAAVELQPKLYADGAVRLRLEDLPT